MFCEGNAKRDGSFDARCFRTIFATEFPDTEFLSLGSASEVEKNATLLMPAFKQLFASMHLTKVIDRDDRSTAEIADAEKTGTRVLSRRHLESFLFDEEIMGKFVDGIGQAEKLSNVLDLKQKCIGASVSRKNPPDDVKSATGEFYSQLRSLLGLTGYGNDVTAFGRDTLAPLVTPDTATYKQLKGDIFGR